MLIIQIVSLYLMTISLLCIMGKAKHQMILVIILLCILNPLLKFVHFSKMHVYLTEYKLIVKHDYPNLILTGQNSRLSLYDVQHVNIRYCPGIDTNYANDVMIIVYRKNNSIGWWLCSK